MPEHLHYDDDAIYNPETHHEKSDVNVRALIWFCIIFVVGSAAIWLVVLLMYKGFVQHERGRATEPLTAVQRPPDASVPAEPRLQPFPTRDAKGRDLPPNANTPVTDLALMREAEEKTLTTYGWVDRQKGVVRVPIEQGKRMVLQRGLPVNGGATLPPATTSTTGGPQ